MARCCASYDRGDSRKWACRSGRARKLARGVGGRWPESDAAAWRAPTPPIRRRAPPADCDVRRSGRLDGASASSSTRRRWATVLRGYQNAVAGEILRFEGHVAKFMGDGVLAYFGWPVAHEDEAERAVRAGLAIVAAVGRLSAGDTPLACRIGVATGPRRGRRADRRGGGAGADGGRRDAQSGGPAAGRGRAGPGGDHRGHAAAGRRLRSS